MSDYDYNTHCNWIGLVIEIRLSEEEEKNSFDEEKRKRLIIFTRNNYEINCTLPICPKEHQKNVFLKIRTTILRKEMKNLNLIQKRVKNLNSCSIVSSIVAFFHKKNKNSKKISNLIAKKNKIFLYFST